MSLLQNLHNDWTQLQKIKEEAPNEVQTGIRLATDISSRNDELNASKDLAEKIVKLNRTLQQKTDPLQFYRSINKAYSGTTSDDVENMLNGLQTIHRLPDQIVVKEITGDTEVSLQNRGNRPVLKIVTQDKNEIIPLTQNTPTNILKTRFQDYEKNIEPLLENLTNKLSNHTEKAQKAGKQVTEATSPYTLLKNL